MITFRLERTQHCAKQVENVFVIFGMIAFMSFMVKMTANKMYTNSILVYSFMSVVFLVQIDADILIAYMIIK